MRIVVTGGSGFIGSNFLRFMIEKYPEYDFINFSKGRSSRLKYVENKANYKLVEGNLCDKKKLQGLLKNTDCIFHFAAESRVDSSIKFPERTIRSNIEGTNFLLEAAKNNNVKKFIYFSTSEVYGEKLEGCFKESDRLNPKNPYADSKAAAEVLSMTYHHAYGLPVIIVRTCNVFGPYQNPDRIIPRFITNLLKNEKIPLYGDGSNFRTYIYIEDLCNALNILFNKGEVGEAYNISTSDEITNIDLTRRILKRLGKSESSIEFVPGRKLDNRRFLLDTNKIHSLGWEQKTKFEDALNKTIEWYKNNKNWLSNSMN